MREVILLWPEAIRMMWSCMELPLLNDYAVSARYPGAYEAVDENEYDFALFLAQTVVAWVEEYLKKRI